MTSLVFEPLIPIAVWLSLAVAAAALWAWYGRDCLRRLGRRTAWAVLALMAAAVILPLVILLNPIWRERVPPPSGKMLLTVLVDASLSMATPDGPDGASRFAEARHLAEAIDASLGQRFDVQLRTFTTSVTPTDEAQLATFKPEGQFTDLAGSLTQVLQADRPEGQAIVLLSDGIHNAGGGEAAVLETAERARSLAAPIYTRTVGGTTSVRDLAVEVQSPQDLAFVRQKIPLRVELEPRGLAGGVARVSLWQEDRQVDQREVPLGDGTTEVEFPLVHERSGVFRYEVRVEPFADEVTTVNNASTYVLRVVDEPIRVLLLEGKPYWDTKFLVRTLTADQAVELVSVVRLTEGRYLERALKRPGAEGKDAKPAVAPEAEPAELAGAQASADTGGTRSQAWRILTSPSELFSGQQPLSAYQIVVLGRDAESYLTEETTAQLKRWLARDGGSLVCFRGTPTVQMSQRLASLLPVRSESARETRFRVKLTDAGRQLRFLASGDGAGGDVLGGLPTLATRSQSTGAQPLAVVWAESEAGMGGTPAPVVTSMPYGTGRVVVVEGAGMWRWAFMAPQYQKQEPVYAALWQSLTRWLVSNTGLLPTQTWSLRSDKVRFANTEQATASLLVRPEALTKGTPEIELTGGQLEAPRRLAPLPSGSEPGAFRVAFGKLPEGRYEAVIVGSDAGDSTARAAFEVRANMDEVLRLQANPGLMRQLAERSGGKTFSASAPEEIAASLEEHLARLRPEQIRTTPAWDRWWVLVGVFACWSAAWGLRRHQGLV